MRRVHRSVDLIGEQPRIRNTIIDSIALITIFIISLAMLAL